MEDERKTTQEYEKPEIRDLGELKDLTAQHTTTGRTDVPKGTRGPTVFSP